MYSGNNRLYSSSCIRFIIFLLSLCLSQVANAQSTFRITGRVIDSVTRQSIEYTTLTISDRITKKVVSGAITDTSGQFVVQSIQSGIYSISIEFIGYRKKIIDSVAVTAKNVPLGTILLSPAGQTLKAVTISGSAPIIENKIDKLVYNAANDITAQGGMALDILKKVPQVNVDIDGNVELQGNANIRFLINGKPSSVFGNSITDALAAIPASQIKSIEVITSPGAKYDAQGTGGIINIILKDNKIQGINGSINLSGGTRLNNASANLNVRHGCWGINTYLSGNKQIPSHTPATQDRLSTDNAGGVTHLVQDGYTDFARDGYQGGIGFDWSITKHDNITASLSYNHYGNGGSGITRIIEDSVGIAVPAITRNATSNFHTNSIDASLNYKKEFKKEGQELNMLYSTSIGRPHSDYSQTLTSDLNNLPYNGTISNNPGTDNEQAISIDYTHPVSSKVNVEAGAKAQLQDITSIADVNDLTPLSHDYVHDAGQSYHLRYNRQVYAAYGSVSMPLSSFLKIKAGLRYEHTNTKIDFPNTSVPAYNSLMPSLTFSHDFTNGFIKLSYSRRLERPDYGDINPFLNRSDPYNITTGNPFLKPEIGNNTELGLNKSLGKSGNVYIALIERINTQDHKRITTFYPEYQAGDSVLTNVSVTNVQNTGTEYNTGINVSGSYNIKEKLSLRGNVFATHRYLMTSIGSGNIDAGIRLRVNLNISYVFPHNLVAEAFGNYNSATNNIQGRSPQNISYTMAFRKQFWDKKASIGVTATNLFNEYTRQVTTINSGSYTSYSVRSVPYRSVGISFTYKFGKLEFKKNKDEENYLNNQPVMGG
ncbi:TonB-dependent receptor [Flavipsychrobacter stenotrophus]|uniref:TonB-dependent receptor n=1 Tax=Flavipsychrobacter stenotrophus TaxID=2077091 RepID=A0A2S7SVD8_9BACT|nr:TonB-dependent receptor [Flavipsychrobacter stenotrophus]PQJ10678.1 TonB-dependent receptor [Flavipsychrobacter stenotrophus]